MQVRPLITVKEARKLLGSDSANLTDDQVIEIIGTLTKVARKYLDNNSSKKRLGI